MNIRHPLKAARLSALVVAPAIATLAFAQEQQRPVQEQVIVTSTPLRERSLEVAQPTTVLTGDDLARQLAASVGETLQSVPGISGTYFGPVASRPVIRGLSGERVVVLEDDIGGLDVSSLSPDHAVTVDSVLAKQVEVVKGPATLLYGNGTIGGVVNLVTDRVPRKRPDRPVGGEVGLRTDTAVGEKSISGHLDGGAGSFAFHLDGNWRETDNVEIPDFALSDQLRAELEAAGEPVDLTRGTVRNSLSESQGGAFGVSYVGESGSYLGVAASRFETAYGIPGPEEEEEEEPAAARSAGALQVRPAGVGIDAEGVNIEMDQKRYDLRGAMLMPESAITEVRVLGTFSDYEHQEFEPDGATGTLFEQEGLEARLVADHAPIAGWRGTFGVQYREIDFTATGEEAFIPQSVTDNVGLYAFEERPFGAVTLELGTRVENQNIDPQPDGLPDYDEDSVSVSGGLVWKFADERALAFHLTRSERHPTATELYADGPHLAIGRFEIGDAALEREVAVTADLSLRSRRGPVRYEITVFRNDFADYIFPQPTGDVADGLPVVQYTQADAEFQGVEAELLWRLAESAAGALHLRLAGDYVRGKLTNGDDLPQVPPLRFGTELRFDRDRWQAGVGAWYYDTQDKTAANELPTDSYTLVDADLGYSLPWNSGRLFVFVRGSNLLDEDARRHTSPLKDFVPLPGRSLSAGARMQF